MNAKREIEKLEILTQSQLDAQDKLDKVTAASALGRSKSPRKAASSRENGKKGGRIAQASVDRWLEEWRPDLASFEDQWGNKGIYRKSYGPSADFSIEGKTWKQVLDFLKGDEN